MEFLISSHFFLGNINWEEMFADLINFAKEISLNLSKN